MKYALLLSMAVPAVTLTVAPCHALEIQNFRAGLLCDLDAKFATGDVPINWICFETETVYVTGQGQCTFDSQEKKCTWYGYEFDYSNASEEDEITCVSTSSVPVTIGTPKGVEKKNATVHEVSYTLPPGNGHHFNPQYSVSAASRNQESHETETVCSVGGRDLFRFRFTTIYPGLTDHVRQMLIHHSQK